MVDVARALAFLFPSARVLEDYVVKDDGNGAYIAQWNLPNPQPTVAELLAAEAQAVIALATAANNKAVQDQIDALEKKQIRAIREALLNKPGAVARLQSDDTTIADLRTKLK